MAMNIVDIPYRSIAVVAATIKAVVGVKAAAAVALKLLEASASFDGPTSTNAPAVVDFSRSTFATQPPGTLSTSVTPNKRDPGRAEAFGGTAAFDWSTTQPTVLTVQHSKDVGQFNGLYHYINPFAAPHIIVGGQGFVISITSPNNVNVTGHLTCEE